VTWPYAIATNLVKDRYGYRTRHPQVSLDAESDLTGHGFQENLAEHKPTPSESVQAAERAEAVRAAVGELPEDLRTPLILSEYEELSHADIGAILKCSAKAVETRIYRARKHLRTRLEHFFGRDMRRAFVFTAPAILAVLATSGCRGFAPVSFAE